MFQTNAPLCSWINLPTWAGSLTFRVLNFVVFLCKDNTDYRDYWIYKHLEKICIDDRFYMGSTIMSGIRLVNISYEIHSCVRINCRARALWMEWLCLLNKVFLYEPYHMQSIRESRMIKSLSMVVLSLFLSISYKSLRHDYLLWVSLLHCARTA